MYNKNYVPTRKYRILIFKQIKLIFTITKISATQLTKKKLKVTVIKIKIK
jgi:hypothetical protein